MCFFQMRIAENNARLFCLTWQVLLILNALQNNIALHPKKTIGKTGICSLFLTERFGPLRHLPSNWLYERKNAHFTDRPFLSDRMFCWLQRRCEISSLLSENMEPGRCIYYALFNIRRLLYSNGPLEQIALSWHNWPWEKRQISNWNRNGVFQDRLWLCGGVELIN